MPLPWRKVIVIILLIAYALLCGLRPPVLRALAMSSVLLLGGSGAERGRLLCRADTRGLRQRRPLRQGAGCVLDENLVAARRIERIRLAVGILFSG